MDVRCFFEWVFFEFPEFERHGFELNGSDRISVEMGCESRCSALITYPHHSEQGAFASEIRRENS
jgi:hypothetical protein